MASFFQFCLLPVLTAYNTDSGFCKRKTRGKKQIRVEKRKKRGQG
jgi:hypothetical protein